MHSREKDRDETKVKVTLRTAMAMLFAQTIGMAAIGGYLWEKSGREVADLYAISFADLLLGIALAGVFVALAFALFRGLPDFADRLVRLQARSYGFLGPKLTWWAIIFISLCAGVGEEALFRSGIQTYLVDHLGPFAAIVLASALFAALHLSQPIITAFLFVAGAMFGTAFWFSQSLFAVAVAHVAYDIWALRYLHNEFLRLGLVGKDATALVNSDASV